MQNRIRELRLSIELTQAELATLLGVNQSAVGKYERSELEPNIETLKKLSAIFDCSIDYILNNSDDFGTLASSPTATSSLPADESELLKLYRQLPYEGKQRLIARAEVMLEDVDSKNKYGA